MCLDMKNIREKFRCEAPSAKRLWTFECKDGHVRPPAPKVCTMKTVGHVKYCYVTSDTQ